MEHPVMPQNLSDQAARVLSSQAPTQMKMMAASGMAPLPPADMVKVLYCFSYDADQALAGKARESLGKMPDSVLLSSLAGEKEAAVIDGLALLLWQREDVAEKIVLNQATDGETVAWMTTRLRSERLLEMVAANESRLLANPPIIEALYMNKASRMSTVDRVIELAVRNGLELDGIPTFAEAKAAIQGQLIVEPEEEPAPEDMEFQSVLFDETAQEFDSEKVDDILQKIESGELDDGMEEEEHRKVATLEASISGMSVSQKIRMAMLGNASQRAVLIRDANKLVTMSVLKSPGISESEVIVYSKARSLPEEAVRYIAHKKDWTKAYQVKLNLVNNPRTPLQDALRFLNHLRPNDVRTLERSRDVPKAIVNAAKQLRQKRGR